MKTCHPPPPAGATASRMVMVMAAWILGVPSISQSASLPADDRPDAPAPPQAARAAPSWGDVAFAQGTFVTVGTDGAIAVSPNGEEWHPRCSGTTTTLRAVTWGADRWVVVGDGGLVLTSTDLLTWQRVSTPTRLGLSGVSFADCQYVAVGEGGTILTSEDAATWRLEPSGTGRSLRSVTRAWGLFWVGGADRTLLRSRNGQRWSSAIPPGFFGITHLVAEEGHLMAAGCGGILEHSREDGRWLFHPVNGARVISGLAPGPAGAVAVGHRGTICLRTAPHGSGTDTWIEVPSGTRHHLEAVAHGMGRYVAVGHADTRLLSTEGRVWRPARRLGDMARREGERVRPN